MSERAREALDEWIAGVMSVGQFPSNRSDAEAFKEHAVGDLMEDGITEGELETAVGGDFAGYLLRVLHPDWNEEKGAPATEEE